ncbi:DUF4912 domain-containing protein [Priestia megaterium]|nr:DUF4912 domain-containing protein [Priestia megaterium]
MGSMFIEELDACMASRINSTTIYVHWTFSKAIKNMIEKLFFTPWDKLDLVLCVYDVTGLYFNGHESNRYVFFPINPIQTSLFIEKLDSNCTYIIDIGIHSEHGSFFALNRSNRVNLNQQSCSSNKSELDWITAPLTSMNLESDSFSTYSYYSNDLDKVKKQYE